MDARPRLPRSDLMVLFLLQDRTTIVPMYRDHALEHGIWVKIAADQFYRIDSWRYAISKANFLIDSVLHEVFESSIITTATKTKYAITTMSTFEPPRSLSWDEQFEVVLRESLSIYKQSDILKHLRVSKSNNCLVAIFIDLDVESNDWVRSIEKNDLQFYCFDFIPDQALDIFMVDHIIDTIWTQEKIPEGPLTALGTRVITHILKCMNRRVKVGT